MAELEDRKQRLIRELDRSRAELSVHAEGARAHFDPTAKVRAGFVRHRFAWMGAAGLFGLVLAKLPAREKKVVIGRKGDKELAKAGKAGLLLGAVKIAFDLLKPFLLRWFTKRLTGYASASQRSGRRV